MTDTTLYAGLVGQKLHGTIRTNGLAYGGAMNKSGVFKVVTAVGFVVCWLFVLYSIVTGNLLGAVTAVAVYVVGMLVGAVALRIPLRAIAKYTPSNRTGAVSGFDYYTNPSSPLYVFRRER